jgi:hypothetical protein
LLLQPIVPFRQGWSDTISWFKVATLLCPVKHCVSAPCSTLYPSSSRAVVQANWLPAFLQTQGDSSASVVSAIPLLRFYAHRMQRSASSVLVLVFGFETHFRHQKHGATAMA